ncbi:MAG TPA: Hsp20/alpha crystallin family protein [Candidatus Binatia bacterium]|nr:Hsp20/alpha crystallin family protein [Candidatus Binatia bacterium]
MFALAQWSPFSALRELDRELDRMFAHAFPPSTPAAWTGAPFAWMPALECYTQDGRLIVRTDLPGVDPKDVEVTLQGNQLTIKGERKAAYQGDEGSVYREVWYGTFERTVTVPEGIAPDRVRAAFNHGVLEVSLPLPPGLAPHKVPIAIEGQPAKAIEG